MHMKSFLDNFSLVASCPQKFDHKSFVTSQPCIDHTLKGDSDETGGHILSSSSVASEISSVGSIKHSNCELRDNFRSSISAESSSSGLGTMPGSNRFLGNNSKTQDKLAQSHRRTNEVPLCLRKSETLDASSELFLNSRNSTDSRISSTPQQQQQSMRRKPMTSVRADSPAIGCDSPGLGTGDNTGTTATDAGNAPESPASVSNANTSCTTSISDTNGNGSRANAASRMSDAGRSSSLARARKRARNDSRRLGSKTDAHAALLSAMNNGTRDIEGVGDADEDLLEPEDDEDEDGGTVPTGGRLSGRLSSTQPDFSDVDSTMDDMHAGTDMDSMYRGRQRRQAYRIPPRRRDSSLGGYGHSSLYNPNGAGTLPRRHRYDVSLTRATTIGGADSTLRSAQRIAHSIRNGIIPPPPSEPPPATPLSGSLMSEVGAIGVSTGNGGAANLINPFALHLHNQQQQQRQAAAAFAAAVAASGGVVHPQIFEARSPALSSPYLLGGNADASQLLQLQQQALLLQQQQQQLDAQLRQQQQQPQQLLANSLLQPTYNSNYGTLGRPTRADSLGPMQPYLSAAALLSAQQQQQQRQYQTHNSSSQINGLSGLIQSPSSALVPSEQNDAIMNKSTSAQGGSGSVVYENSYNSFHRLLSNTLPPSASQDGLHSLLTSGIAMSDALTMNMNSASPHVTAPRANTLSRTDNLSPVGLGTISAMTAGAACAASPPPPVPPPNHPSYDLVDARTVDSSYGGPHSAEKQLVNAAGRKSKRRCPWYYWIISILVLAFLLALVLAISFSAEKRHLGDRLIERLAQDPRIIGLFDPANPVAKLEQDRPVHVILDRMGVWSAEWHMRTSRYVRYNITVSSALSVIGIFMRRSTMPTIVRYDIFDQISGRTLQTTSRSGRRFTRSTRAGVDKSPAVYRSSSNSEVRETARVHYLEEGIWFLSFVNDQPRPEPFTFTIGDAVMDSGCPNDCSNRGICNRGNCDCVNGFKGPDCSVAELPKVCNDHGYFSHGACQCYPEWKGQECEILWSECVDPTCSSHGQCVTGECHCYDGYGGEACEQKTCVSSNCTGHGVCMDGTCCCFSGWSGLACDIPVPVMHTGNLNSAALDIERVNGPNRISSSSAAVHSTSSPGAIAQLDAQLEKACGLNCGPHAQCVFNKADQPVCHCDPGWTGLLCDRKLCDQRCFEHGHCSNGTCVCQVGWNGKYCTLNGCPDQCSGVGRCLANVDGFYNCHCPPERKGSACQAKVELICDDQEDNDADGLIDCLDPDCCASAHCRQLAQLDTRREEGGGSETRLNPAAEDAKQGCAHSEPAQYHLLITPMAQADSTFYGQLEFLLKREQIVMRNFDPRRISVIRGTVRQWDGTAFWGCRVFDRLKAETGYTLTDEQGRFDLPVEGGSIVQLEFLRFPTKRFSAIQPVYVPVNEIITLGDFYLHDASRTASEQSGGGRIAPSPVFHDLWSTGLINTVGSSLTLSTESSKLGTDVTTTATLMYMPETEDTCAKHDLTVIGGLPVWVDQVTDSAAVCLDQERTLCIQNGVLTYAIPIHDTRLRLIYRTDRAIGYRPVLIAQLLDQVIPDGLREIHLILDVAGLRQTKRLEPEPGLTEFFHWNKTDGYNRTVYGLINARVSAGYVYVGCSRVFWEHRTVPLLGYELTESGLANWKLDLVHLYAVNQGIVYRGDGSHLFLKLTDWHVTGVLGSRTTRRKPNMCDYCSTNQSAFGSPVLRLPALITDSLGHVVAGDGSRLRWLQSPESTHEESLAFRSSEGLDSRAKRAFLSNDRQVWFTVNQFPLEFLSTGFDEMEQSNYYLAAHPTYLALKRRFGASDPNELNSGLFLSHTSSKSIWWLSDSSKPVAQPLLSPTCSEQSSGLLPDPDLCIKHAFVAPRGLAVSPNDLFFADGNLIFAMSLLGSPGNPRPIRLVVGQRGVRWISPPCDHARPGTHMTLRSPTHLVYNAVEDALYFVDNKQVYRLHLASHMVSLAAGILDDCRTALEQDSETPLATAMSFTDIRGLAVSPEGDLYVAEPHRVWLRRADGRLYAVVGRPVTNNRDRHELPSDTVSQDSESGYDFGLAKDMRLSNITAIAVSIYGELFIADSEHAMVYRVHHRLPRPSASTPTYRILSPGTDEAYTFNENGQLLQTENAITQMTLHLINYRANAIYGWVSDLRGNNVNLRFDVHRDTQGRLRYVQSPTGLRYNITLDSGPQQHIRELTDPIRGSKWQFFYSSTGLLIRLRRPQDTTFIQFDYATESGRLERILFPNGMSLFVDQLDTLGTNPFMSSTRLSRTNRSIGHRDQFHCYYGEADDPWTVQFVQNYPKSQFGSGRRSAKLSRHIQLPGRLDQTTLSNSVVWTFDRNVKVSTGSRLARARRQAHHDRIASPTQLARILKVGSDSGWLVQSLAPHYLTRTPRSVFSYLSSALSLSGYRAAAGESVEWQQQKTLVVNGYDVLHVKFDWARQLETYQRASTGHVLLQVVYNADFQPMIFNASSIIDSQNDYLVDASRSRSWSSSAMLPEYNDYSAFANALGPAPLSLTYNSNGQLNAFHWGSAIYRFTHDAQNRLKAADLGSPAETVSYQYADERLPYQPSVVTVNGLGPFKLFYATTPLAPMERHMESTRTKDAPSNFPLGLTRILTPSGLRRDFSRLIGVYTHQLRFIPWPGAPAPWVYEWGQDVNASNARVSRNAEFAQPRSELLRFIWPSGYRRITVFPDQDQLVYDKTLIGWQLMGLKSQSHLRRLDSAPFVQLIDVSSGYRWEMWRTYRGTLLTSVQVEQRIPGARNAHPTLGGLLHARHQYTYNQNLNLIGIHTQLYTQSNRPDNQAFVPLPDKIALEEHTTTKYDIITGQLLSIRDLDIVHRASSICATYAPKSMQLCRQLDNQGRLKQVVLYPLSSRRDPLYNLSVIYRPNSLYAVQQREEQRGQVPRWVNFVYGSGGHLEALDREEAGSSLRSHSVLVHNSEGRLARLRIAVSDPQLHHSSPRDHASHADTGPTSRSEELQFVYDARGLLKRRGNWQYTFDEDGFLTERRLHNDHIVDRFAYNSKGLLIWAERKITSDTDQPPGSGTRFTGSSQTEATDKFHSFDQSPLEDDIGSRRAFRIQYVYDAQDRLVVVRDTLIVRDLMQYFYADPAHPHRITHVFNHGRLVTFRLHYDPANGHLFAVEEFARLISDLDRKANPLQDESQEKQHPITDNQKHVYFVITNHEGAPTAMFSENGDPSWTAEYSVTGSRRLYLPNRNKFFGASILEDANIPLGYAGCLVDVHTGFLFCPPTYRAYDPSGATFLSPDWRRLVSDRLPKLYRDPSVLDTHKWGALEQQDLDLGPDGLFARVTQAIQHPSWWLKFVGFRLDGVLPRLDSFTGRLNSPDPTAQWHLPVLPDHLGPTLSPSRDVNCPLVSILNTKLERLSVVQPSHLTPGGIRGTGLPDFFLQPSHLGDTGRIQLIPAQFMFDSGVVLDLHDSHDGQMLNVQTFSASNFGEQNDPKNIFESGQLANLLLEGTRLMDWWTSTDGPNSRLFVHLFSRLGYDASNLVDDLASLGVRLPVYHRLTGHNLTLMSIGGQNEVWLTRNSLQWRIRFVSSWTEAWDRIAWDAQRRGEQLAWSREAQMAQKLDLVNPARDPHTSMDRMAESSTATHFLGLQYLWTFKQAYQLAREGQLSGYRWVSVVNHSEKRLFNGTAWTRLYENPGVYQLRAIDSKKPWRNSG